jgi:hypothetical protein
MLAHTRYRQAARSLLKDQNALDRHDEPGSSEIPDNPAGRRRVARKNVGAVGSLWTAINPNVMHAIDVAVYDHMEIRIVRPSGVDDTLILRDRTVSLRLRDIRYKVHTDFGRIC